MQSFAVADSHRVINNKTVFFSFFSYIFFYVFGILGEFNRMSYSKKRRNVFAYVIIVGVLLLKCGKEFVIFKGMFT